LKTTYTLSIEANDEELAEMVRLVSSCVGLQGSALTSDPAPPSGHGILDLAHAAHFLFEAGESLALGVLANQIYARLSARSSNSELSLHESNSKREVEIFDMSSGLRIRIRESIKESTQGSNQKSHKREA
jgi:hypothetical protein